MFMGPKLGPQPPPKKIFVRTQLFLNYFVYDSPQFFYENFL